MKWKLYAAGILVLAAFLLARSGTSGPVAPVPAPVAAPVANGRPHQEQARQTVYGDLALDASKEAMANLVAARARYWLDEARRVESASGQPVEGFMLDKMATNNQRLRAMAGGRRVLPVAEQDPLSSLVVDQVAFQVALYRLRAGDMPEGYPEAFQLDIGSTLKATAEYNDDRRLFLNAAPVAPTAPVAPVAPTGKPKAGGGK
jgi:hypothetical protein